MVEAAAGEKRLAGVHARRVIFIDLARAVAVVFMLYGHAVDALLAPVHRHGVVYDLWQFQRGLTSCLFLLLSGFAFSIATVRHWPAQLSFSPAVYRRARRFVLFILLGYALRIPVAPLAAMGAATDVQWRVLLSVDVLHLIGVTFLVVQALVMITRSPQVFTAVTLVLALAVVLVAPAAWSTDWTARLPLSLASYLSPSTGSLFPLLPWSAFILAGAALGQLYARRGAGDLGRYANTVLLLPAAALLGVWLVLDRNQVAWFGPGVFSFVPANMFLRAGACLLILGGVAHVSRRMTRLPHVFGAVAQESLVIYFVHICLVYGSIWNPGLARWFTQALTPGALVPIVVVLIGLMALLAWQWNVWKHTRPTLARRIAIGVWLLMAVRLV